MHDTAQLRKVSTLPPQVNIARPLDVDFSQIERDGYQVVRRFGPDAKRLETELCRVSGGKLFFSARLGSFVHEFRVLPHSENLSEQASCGGYHTDFMFQPCPPAFVALLCLRPDPKHPMYGRNQVVHRDAFLERMENVYGITKADLLKQKVDYPFPGRAPISLPILQRLNDQLILTLHTSLMPCGTLPAFDNLPLKSVIDAICGEIAEDIVLDQGDLLIVSNHTALHRRSECTLAFNAADRSFKSREMATVRFDR
ncbi:MAG: hypothetical protein PCALPYG88_7178 [uncultured Paraburkholderia sp.]|uniref:hypothetical protein n=1 Tax=uncultured Paraburkholderia sp. TaxID=1822466 RepID=UPI0025954680|nr:hypothetical protein [uncultured Paraburkholderia sp.]CAH2904091.1 MAG: hypothetical protein PCALPYG08_7195 [uncultured Paraburkholderia sp.]CAH2942299.1 MAG: hypothetical protein PCALPYG88_7178 [uncultured Paraburkholderia sp.]